MKLIKRILIPVVKTDQRELHITRIMGANEVVVSFRLPGKSIEKGLFFRPSQLLRAVQDVCEKDNVDVLL